MLLTAVTSQITSDHGSTVVLILGRRVFIRVVDKFEHARH